MEKVVQSKKPHEHKSLSPSINLICSKCDSVISKQSLQCNNCNIKYRNFDEGKN